MDFAADLRVEAGGGLVEENDVGLVDHGQGDRETLLLPPLRVV